MLNHSVGGLRKWRYQNFHCFSGGRNIASPSLLAPEVVLTAIPVIHHIRTPSLRARANGIRHAPPMSRAHSYPLLEHERENLAKQTSPLAKRRMKYGKRDRTSRSKGRFQNPLFPKPIFGRGQRRLHFHFGIRIQNRLGRFLAAQLIVPVHAIFEDTHRARYPAR